MSRVAVVTGSNKGIGFAIVRALCKQPNLTVYLTARNSSLGEQAVAELQREGLNPQFHQLDIDNVESVKDLAQHLKDKYGGLDVLVNNAAIAFKQDDATPFPTQAEVTSKTNFFATLNACNILFPLLRSHARVVNVSSRVGLLKSISNQETRDKLTNPNATVQDVIDVLNQFIEATKENKHQSLGFPNSAYGMSKIALTALTRIQQRELDQDKKRQDIVINACCPGYVATDMSSHLGSLTIDQGAITPVYLATLPENVTDPRGEFLAEKQVHPWVC